MLNLTLEERMFISKKFNSLFKKLNNPFIDHLLYNDEFTLEEVAFILSKLDYKFLKSEDPILDKLRTYLKEKT